MRQALKPATTNLQGSPTCLADAFFGGALKKALITLATVFACSILFKQPLLAASTLNTSTDPTWYEIEVLIFSRVNPEAEQVEIWKRFLNVSFPSQLTVLDTDFKSSELRYHKIFPQDGNKANNSVPEAKLIPLWPPYTHMGDKNSKLNQAKKRLQRNGNFQILSHYHWVQPLVDRKETHPILVQAGKVYGDQYQLEGTIALSVSRYLHIDTNLWLSAFTENQTLLDTWWINTDNDNNETPLLSKAHQTQSRQCSKNFTTVSKQIASDNHSTASRNLTTDYITTQIAELKQSRRMRSGEIHYLDHPLFGVIVTANPYDPLSEK